MMLRVVSLVVVISFIAVVKCQEAVTEDNVETQKKLGVVYLIPLFQKLPKKENEIEENLNEIDDESERKILSLPRLLLILAPTSNKELPDEVPAEEKTETAPEPESPAAQERTRRSPSGFGGGCNSCGYNPGGGGHGGGGHGGGGQGHGGGGTGSWSSSSSSASSGSWGGGGGSGGKYQHGRK